MASGAGFELQGEAGGHPPEGGGTTSTTTSSAVAVTPQRRPLRAAGTPRQGEEPRGGGGGLLQSSYPSSPVARRPRAGARARAEPRGVAEEAEQPDVRQMHADIETLKTEIEQEAVWSREVNDIAENHANIINGHTQQMDLMQKTIFELRQNMDSVVGQVIENANRLKHVVEQNDLVTKQNIEMNDGKLKKAIDDVYVEVHRLYGWKNGMQQSMDSFKDEMTAMRLVIQEQGDAIGAVRGSAPAPGIQPPGGPCTSFIPEVEIRLERGVDLFAEKFRSNGRSAQAVGDGNAALPVRDRPHGFVLRKHGDV